MPLSFYKHHLCCFEYILTLAIFFNDLCLTHCIEMKEDEEGFIYPIVNQDECRECGLCNKVCPELNVKRCKNEFNNVYVASNKDKQVLQKSSSGGIFYELAKNTQTQFSYQTFPNLNL